MSTGPLSLSPGTGPLPYLPPASAEAPAASESIFKNPAFVRLWLGQASSQLGDRIHHVALMWWTLDTTGSLAKTGLVMIATTLPAVLLGPVAGAVADRFDRKTLMVAADALRALLVLGLGLLALWGQLSFPAVLAASALLACLTAFFMPANMAMLPSVVKPDQLLRANSLMEMTIQGAGLMGPALGGLVVAIVGAGAAFGANGLSFALSALLLMTLAAPKQAGESAGEPFLESMKGGFRLLRRDPTIGGLLLCFACLNFFSVSILLFLPHFAKEVFHVGATGLGVLEATVAGGMLAAALLWARLGKVSRRFPIFFGSILGIAAMYLAMGLAPSIYGFGLALAVTGALFASINVVVMAFFQERVPASEMGRFMGLLTSLVFGLMPLSYGVFGMLAGMVPPTTLLMVNGAAIGGVAFLLWLVPGLRRV
ncbi:MAG: MFS transporter [Candidatus Sericytochromatia bacterium]